MSQVQAPSNVTHPVSLEICNDAELTREGGDIWGMFLRKDFNFALACRDRKAALHLGTLCYQCGQLCRCSTSKLPTMRFGQAKLKNKNKKKCTAFEN